MVLQRNQIQLLVVFTLNKTINKIMKIIISAILIGILSLTLSESKSISAKSFDQTKAGKFCGKITIFFNL